MMGDGIGDRTGEGAFRYGATKGTRAAHDPGCKYPGAGSSYKQFLLILQLEPLVNHSAGGGRGDWVVTEPPNQDLVCVGPFHASSCTQPGRRGPAEKWVGNHTSVLGLWEIPLSFTSNEIFPPLRCTNVELCPRFTSSTLILLLFIYCLPQRACLPALMAHHVRINAELILQYYYPEIW